MFGCSEDLLAFGAFDDLILLVIPSQVNTIFAAKWSWCTCCNTLVHSTLRLDGTEIKESDQQFSVVLQEVKSKEGFG